MKTKADIGVYGLAVMGENLVLNMERNGFVVACANRTVEKVDAFLAGRGRGLNLIGCHSVADLAKRLKKPRIIMLMVKAGRAVDEVIEALLPHLESGDIIVDGGNSFYDDTACRCRFIAEKGFRFVGAGVSGGEEGALNGPSIMPGGDRAAWPFLKPVLQAIAAKVDDGTPCCEWIGPAGSGHFVKMVHNGIEYGDMQLISEAYHLMSRGLGMPAWDIADVFAGWNSGVLESYLIEITAHILSVTDPETGLPLVDVILDAAEQKGTGKWTSLAGLDLGVAIPQIAEAVFARALSAIKEQRVAASAVLQGPGPHTGNAGPATSSKTGREAFIDRLQQAVFASKICCYAQGFQLLRTASETFGYQMNYGDIALIWREGCIIRAQFLGDIKQAFLVDPNLSNLLLAPYFTSKLASAQSAWRETVKTAVDLGIPVPAMSAALNYYDAYRCGRLPANLLQAQRDYFGAHTYERIDRPRGVYFHTRWTD